MVPLHDVFLLVFNLALSDLLCNLMISHNEDGPKLMPLLWIHMFVPETGSEYGPCVPHALSPNARGSLGKWDAARKREW